MRIGLREKRSMIGGGKTPTLSELLREAKADSEGQGAKGSEASGDEHTPLTYSRLFDEYKGAKKTTVNVSVVVFMKLFFLFLFRCCAPGSSRSSIKGM